jgi:hypothetical protein
VAIHYLLYACVECGREGGIKRDKADKGAEVCDRCHARYTRIDGARIQCESPNKPAVVHTAAEWLDILAEMGLAREFGHEARVVLRISEHQKPYYELGVYLGRIEQFGAPIEGEFSMTAETIRFVSPTGPSFEWRLDDLTAVQPSSTSLQLKIRHGPILSFKFPGGSPLLWEERIHAALQARFTATGRGNILEFQPRIVCG